MRQIFIIHGGNTFSTHEDYLQDLKNSSVNLDQIRPQAGWKVWLAEQLPTYDVYAPKMPTSDNAQYDEWRIAFEKLIPFFTPDTMLVGHSLGGIFLAKYLSSHPLSAPVDRIILVAAPYDDETNESLASFRLTKPPTFDTSAANIHFMHAKDDVVVPFTELSKYQHALPSATIHEYETGNHFFWPEFPELLDVLIQK